MKHSLQLASSIVIVLLCILTLVLPAYATNGMNMEGYGPIATGMGGASMAYDNGTAAVMNNPATLGLMPEGNRLDVLLGFLGPNVRTTAPGAPAADSTSDLFIMPAVGWVRKSGSLAYGIGVFAQGGMGTQYDAGTWPTFGSPGPAKSELGVGRAIIPLAYNLTKDLAVAVSFDYVWASLDVQMALPGAQFAGMVTSCAGSACSGLSGLASTPWTRIDFTDGGADNGSARGTGYAGKLGATYRISDALTVGATYHSKTYLDNLETGDMGAIISAAGAGPIGIGKISVLDFQWPETYGVGVAWNATERLMIASDCRRIDWHTVMKDFKMSYQGALGGASNNVVNFAIPQNWNNQNVYEIGAAYRFTKELTGRIGANISDNPIPDIYLNYLFPATVKDHYTAGVGYAFTETSVVDLSLTYAPEVSATASGGVTTTHGQRNAQLMYSYRF